MAASRHIDAVCVAILAVTLLLTVLFMNGEALGIQKVVDGDAEVTEESGLFTRNDLQSDWSTAGATAITLHGDRASVSGGGAFAYGGSVMIVSGGRYVVSGTLTDGSIVVDTDSNAKVWILLDGAEIRCQDGACLRVEQAKKAFITLAEGTQSRLESETFSLETLEQGIDGALFSRDNLTINGSGRLTVVSENGHGIVGNDSLVITGGEIEVRAGQDALHVNDALAVTGVSLTLEAGDDGISSDGPVLISGGVLQIRAEDDGIHSGTSVTVSGGSIRIPECYEGIEAVTIDISGGETVVYPVDDGLNANGGSDIETSETWIRISGGSVTVINEGGRDADGLDSNGDILISGGSVRVSLSDSGRNSALDCGRENGGVLEISGGTVIACGSNSLAEAFDSSSAQSSVLYIVQKSIAPGTVVGLEDSEGNILLSYEVPCSFTSVAISCPEMKIGETCTIVIGDYQEKIMLEEISACYGNVQNDGSAVR